MPAEDVPESVVLPITGELDLHPFRPGEVTRLLDDYFSECRKRGISRVRVIHGKGTGILRETVQVHLRRSPGVSSFATGDEYTGGWGATLVTLRRLEPDCSGHSSGCATVRHFGICVSAAKQKHGRMSTKFLYALMLTLCGVVLNLLLFFTGYQTEKLATGQYFQWFGFVAMIIVLWLGIAAVRDESENKTMSYGRGVATGVLISLYSGLMSAVYNFIHFKFVNPNFADYQIELIRPKWVAAGMGDAQIEQAEHFTRMMTTPLVNAILTPFVAVLFGLILSLILAAFLKRKAPEGVIAST